MFARLSDLLTFVKEELFTKPYKPSRRKNVAGDFEMQEEKEFKELARKINHHLKTMPSYKQFAKMGLASARRVKDLTELERKADIPAKQVVLSKPKQYSVDDCHSKNSDKVVTSIRSRRASI